jgi:hypothetical protein
MTRPEITVTTTTLIIVSNIAVEARTCTGQNYCKTAETSANRVS